MRRRDGEGGMERGDEEVVMDGKLRKACRRAKYILSQLYISKYNMTVMMVMMILMMIVMLMLMMMMMMMMMIPVTITTSFMILICR